MLFLLQGLHSKVKCFQQETQDSIKQNVKTAPRPLWAAHVFESTGKDIAVVLAGVIYPGNHREIGLLLHNGDKEEYI